MNKQEQLAAITRIEYNAGLLKEVARQITEEATRLEDQAKSVRLSLGSDTGRALKGKPQLTPEITLQVKGSLTRKAPNRKTA